MGEIDKEIVATGYAKAKRSKSAHIHDWHAYLGFMFVSAKHRGKGLNKAIVDELLDWARAKHFSAAYLDVYPENEGAITAYKKLRFEPSLLEMRVVL